MTGVSPLLAVLGGAAVALGAAIFAGFLVAVRRRRRSANLEYGVMPAAPAAGGLWLLDLGLGWPGWPGPAYVLVALGLAVLFSIAIVRARR